MKKILKIITIYYCATLQAAPQKASAFDLNKSDIISISISSISADINSNDDKEDINDLLNAFKQSSNNIIYDCEISEDEKEAYEEPYLTKYKSIDIKKSSDSDNEEYNDSNITEENVLNPIRKLRDQILNNSRNKRQEEIFNKLRFPDATQD
ncbi:MAG: hypothetical protein BGO07_02245 [Alphaproteobacteria bacterium 40-19]|nr:MAG: hypothetical protein BGO07_02245 [Alphaproteobacteria bacterium 40-19]